MVQRVVGYSAKGADYCLPWQNFSPKSLVEKSHSGGFSLQIGNARDLICFNRAHFRY